MVTYQTRLYLRGAIGAAINGGSNAVVLALADPATFNIYDGWKKLLTVTALSAILGFFLYIKAHPLPDPEKDTDYTSVRRDAVTKILNTGTGDGAPKPPTE